MTRAASVPTILSAGALLSLLLTAACQPGGFDSGPGTNPGGDDVVRIPADDPAIDDRLDALGIICESTLTVTGTYVPGAEPPPDHLGCWPVGTWTVHAEVDRLGCDPQPAMASDHVYNIVFDEDANTINVAFSNDPADERVNLKISTSGDTLCHGAMEHFGTDNAVWALLPTLQLDGTLKGIGTYSVFEVDPY